MQSLIRQGFAVIHPASNARILPEIGRGTTLHRAHRNLQDLVRKKYLDSPQVVELSDTNTVAEEVVYPDLPQAGRVRHLLAYPLTRQEYHEWLAEGGRLVQEVVPLTRRVLREGVLRLAPQELATLDCDWEWTGSDPTHWPEAVAYLSDEAGRAAILITQVRDAAGLRWLQYGLPVRLNTRDWAYSPGTVKRVLVEVPPMLETAFGYQGHAAKVAFCPEGGRQTLLWWDGHERGAGSWASWDTFLRHPQIRSLLGCHSLGVEGPEARDWLVLDRLWRFLYVGEAILARQYLLQGCIVDRSFQPMLGTPEALRIALQSWLDTDLPRHQAGLLPRQQGIPWSQLWNDRARTEETALQKTPMPDAAEAVAQPSPKGTTQRTTQRTTKRTK